MNLPTERYSDQSVRWPSEGRHILAHYDVETIIVYQAYRPSIGDYAIKHGAFAGEFSYSRMSWIKPNFLWMMYRSAGTPRKVRKPLSACGCAANSSTASWLALSLQAWINPTLQRMKNGKRR